MVRPVIRGCGSPDPVAVSAANLAVHLSWIQARTDGMRAERSPALTVSDSGLACDTFNTVSGARLEAESAPGAIERAIDSFRGRPFSWWVASGDSPASLGSLLEAYGLEEDEDELMMACDLRTLPEGRSWPGELEVRTVATASELSSFAKLLASLWNPPDPMVVEFYERAAAHALSGDCPMRFHVGYLAGRPVATSESVIAGGGVGLYNISTIPSERGRGIGTAMTVVPLRAAYAEGVAMGVLQAAAAGVGVYRRVGFQPIGRMVEYKPGPS